MASKNKLILKTIGFIFILFIVVFIPVSLAFQDSDNDEVVISSMNVYKDMDYSFLKTFHYGSVHEDDAVLTFDIVDDLINSEDIRLKRGKYVRTKGYYAVDDLGGASYYINDQETLGSLKLKNGLYANFVGDIYLANNTKWLVLSIKQFGAKGDGINSDQESINTAFSYADSFKDKNRVIIYMPKGEYKATNQIQANTTNFNLVGEGDDTIIFTDNDYRLESAYDEPFFASWNGQNNFFGFFRIEAREVDIYKYMRQMSLYYNENVYIYGVNYYIPESTWSGKYYEDKQYTNLTIYAGNKIVTVDNCEMYQMSGTYRGANVGIMDFWKTGTENITVMNSKLYDNARDEQIGIFSISGDKNSYIKGVDFVNNEIYSYKTPYANIHGWRTMCFTIAYNDNNVNNINVRDNTFISEADSKFMTFGSVRNCKIENNKFVIKSSNGNMGYVFDSSATNNDDVIINNNEFYLTYKTTPKEGKCLSAGNLTFSNNRVVSDSTILKLSDRLGIYEGNEFISLTPFGSGGSAVKFNNNIVTNYGGHINQYSEIMFMLNEGNENTDIEFIGNTFNDYTYYHGHKNQRVYDRLSSINEVTLNSLNFSNNIYNAPNYSYTTNDYIYATWYRGANIKNIIYDNNDFQGVKNFFGIDTPVGNNITREFNDNINDDLITSLSILYNGKNEQEITVMNDSVSLDYIALINENKINFDNVDWISSLPSIATVQDGKVKRQAYGDVKIFLAAKDGSGIYSEIVIHFVKSKVTSIDVNEDNITIPVGNQHKIIAKVNPYKEVSQDLECTSSDESIITVNSFNDIIAGNTPGSAYVVCKVSDGSNVSKRIDVTVTNLEVTKINLKETYGYFEDIGVTKQLEVTEYLPSDAINKGVGKWVSTNTDVAIVDQLGRVEIVGYGKAVIRVYTKDMSRYATYNIYVKPDKVTGIEVSAYKTRNQITWSQKANVEGYNIYRKESSSDTWVKIASQLKETTTEYYDMNLSPNTSYDYYITAVVFGYDTNTKLEYEGVASDIITSKTTEREPIKSMSSSEEVLSIPLNSISKLYINYSPKNAEFNTFNFKIADSSIISSYKVEGNNAVNYKGEKLGFTYVTVTPDGDNNISLKVPVGVVPTYQVQEVNLEKYYNNVMVRWKPISEEDKIDGYIIYRSSTVEYREIAAISLSDLKVTNGYYEYDDLNLDFNVSYRYTIKPYILHDGNKFPCLASKDVSITIPPYVPITDILTDDSYVMSVGLEKQVVAQSNTENSSSNSFIWYTHNNEIVSVNNNDKNTSIVAKKPGITYLDVIALDEDCNYVTSKVIVVPSKTARLQVSNVLKNEVNLYWDKIDGISGYRIYQYNEGTNKWILLDSVQNEEYKSINLQEGTSYSYLVVGYISDGKDIYEGEKSDTVSVKTLSSSIELPETTKPVTTTKTTTPTTTTTKKISTSSITYPTSKNVTTTTKSLTEIVDKTTTSTSTSSMTNENVVNTTSEKVKEETNNQLDDEYSKPLEKDRGFNKYYILIGALILIIFIFLIIIFKRRKEKDN